VPSFGLPHAAVHCPAAQVGVLPEQGAHASPSLPHSAFWLPAAQEPALQQPPLQAEVGSHAVPHLFFLHAWLAGQSLGCAQPQTKVARQASPSGLIVQSTQAPPEPHVVLPLAAQCPALQQ
jgi:hypothetical protein